jgi:hypothetical protein
MPGQRDAGAVGARVQIATVIARTRRASSCCDRRETKRPAVWKPRGEHAGGIPRRRVRKPVRGPPRWTRARSNSRYERASCRRASRALAAATRSRTSASGSPRGAIVRQTRGSRRDRREQLADVREGTAEAREIERLQRLRQREERTGRRSAGNRPPWTGKQRRLSATTIPRASVRLRPSPRAVGCHVPRDSALPRQSIRTDLRASAFAGLQHSRRPVSRRSCKTTWGSLAPAPVRKQASRSVTPTRSPWTRQERTSAALPHASFATAKEASALGRLQAGGPRLYEGGRSVKSGSGVGSPIECSGNRRVADCHPEGGPGAERRRRLTGRRPAG